MRRLPILLLSLAVLRGFAADSGDWTDDDIRLRLHAPLTAPKSTPMEELARPVPFDYVTPQPLSLPSAEALETTVVRNRDYVIRRVSRRRDLDTSPGTAVALFEPSDEALYCRGSGTCGLESHERLVVEDCTFVLDFEEGNFEKWDAERCSLYVEGFKEVLVRNCVFVSHVTREQEIRRAVGSIVAYDCQKVQVEDCYFAGRTTGWRGHVLVYCCGPTSIRNIEVRGIRDAGGWLCGGGVWVATGLGEGKLGVMHKEHPERMIYPPGPLRVENAWIHDQTGRENNDGIYVQSVHPFLIRNCKVENWRDDALLDLGFRDAASRSWNDRPLRNHGAIGIVEQCELVRGDSKGFVKNSVGAAGGVVFRHNVLRNLWAMPYIFDGGTWYFAGNDFTDLTGPFLCGDDQRGNGWEPGMLKDGSRLVFYRNRFRLREGAKVQCLIRAKKADALRNGLSMDENAYDLNGATVAKWIDDKSGALKAKTFEEWQSLFGADAHSVLGTAPPESSASLALPGDSLGEYSPDKAGLLAPVGVSNPDVRAKGEALVRAFEEHLASSPEPGSAGGKASAP